MTYVKINDTLYPVIIINGKLSDKEWDGRASKSIKLEMDYVEAVNIWVEGLSWSTIDKTMTFEMVVDEEGNPILDENGNPIYQEVEHVTEYDNSDYNVAGDIIIHRDGTVTVKMGKLTELEEAYAMLFGGVE